MAKPLNIERLLKLVGRLGSDTASERAQAAFLASQILRANGLTWEELLRPELERRFTAHHNPTAQRPNDLTEMTASFAETFTSSPPPSPKDSQTPHLNPIRHFRGSAIPSTLLGIPSLAGHPRRTTRRGDPMQAFILITEDAKYGPILAFGTRLVSALEKHNGRLARCEISPSRPPNETPVLTAITPIFI